MPKASAFLLAVAAFSPASGAEQILCTRTGSPDVVVTLDARRQFNRVLSCITGDFVSDLTPCAPDGAYALSAPTGSAALVGIVGRWQDYIGHLGGVTNHFRTPDQISFSGGFNSPDNGFQDLWHFTASRATGRAQLSRPGRPDLDYACRKAARRF